MKKISYNLTIYFMIFSLLYATMPDIYAQSNNNSTNNADKLAPPKIKNRKAEPQEYDQDAFPRWAYYSYRFVAVGVGSIPFSLLFSSIVYDAQKTYNESVAAGSFQNQYLPLFLSGPDKPPYDYKEAQNLIIATLAVSLSLSIIDLAILLIRRQRGNTISNIFR